METSYCTERLLANHINELFLEAISVTGKRDLVLALFRICSHVRKVISFTSWKLGSDLGSEAAKRLGRRS